MRERSVSAPSAKCSEVFLFILFIFLKSRFTAFPNKQSIRLNSRNTLHSAFVLKSEYFDRVRRFYFAWLLFIRGSLSELIEAPKNEQVPSRL